MTATTSTTQPGARGGAGSGPDAGRSSGIPVTFPRDRHGNYDLSRPRWPFVQPLRSPLRSFLALGPVFAVVNRSEDHPEDGAVELRIRLPEGVCLKETYRQIESSKPGDLNVPDLAALSLTPGRGGEARLKVRRHWRHFQWARFVFFLRVYQEGDPQVFRVPFAVSFENPAFRSHLIGPPLESADGVVEAEPVAAGNEEKPADEPQPKLDVVVRAGHRTGIRYPSLFDYDWLREQPWFPQLRVDPLLWLLRTRQVLNVDFQVRGGGWLEGRSQSPLNPRAPGFHRALKLHWFGTTHPKTSDRGDRIPSVELQASGCSRSGRRGRVCWNTFSGYNLPMVSTFYLTWKFPPGDSGEDTLVDPTIICDPPEEPLEP